MRPRVSIILPFFEGLRWLPRTVSSVRHQTETAWELIVVDDGSEEDPGLFVHGLGDNRVRLVRIDHAGKGQALNHGVAAARGELVCFIDQDDIMSPGRLAVQLSAFEREDHADGVYSDYERRHEDGRLIDQIVNRQVTAEEAIHLMAVGRNPVTMQTIMIKKTLIEKLGGFSTKLELTGLDDLEFFVRLFLTQPVMVHVPGVVQAWVLHERNYSKTRKFQEVRLHWLARLAELSKLHPMLKKELKHYRFHSYCMRGMYFLESGCARYAVTDLFKALRFNPFSLNTCYLLGKSLIASTAKRFSVSTAGPK